VLALLEAKLRSLRHLALHNPNDKNAPDPELDNADPLTGFGTPEHRKKVEKAAERAVIAHYRSLGFRCSDLTKLNCGYDFLFQKGTSVLHVEVKGASGEVAGFFLTRNEHSAGYQKNPSWRLAMVTRALSAAPTIQIFDAKQLRKVFDLTPYVFLARPVTEVEKG
jgi:hypothetical protein